MSTDAGYMLIRVDLQGAREAAAEGKALAASVAATGTAAQTANAKTAASSTAATRATRALSLAWKAAKYAALGLGAAVVGLAVAAKSAVNASLDLTKSAVGLNENLGIGIERSLAWASVTKARGVEAKQLAQAMGTLAKNQDAAAKGGEEQMKIFRRLGISQREVVAGGQHMNRLLFDVAKGMDKMGPGAERTATAMRLLGRGWQTINPLMRDGGKALKETLGWTEKYNIATNTSVEDNMALVIAQRESNVAWQGIQATLAEDFIPELTKAHGVFQDFATLITSPWISAETKLTILGDQIEQNLSKAFDWIVDVALPELAEKVGQGAIKVAEGFGRGFLNADVLGKAIMAAWLISKFTKGAVIASVATAGARLGGRFGRAMLERIGLWLIGTGIADSFVSAIAAGGRWGSKISTAASAAGKLTGKAFGKGLVLGVTIGIPLAIAEFGDDLFRIGEQIGDKIWEGVKSILPDPIEEALGLVGDVASSSPLGGPLGTILPGSLGGEVVTPNVTGVSGQENVPQEGGGGKKKGKSFTIPRGARAGVGVGGKIERIYHNHIYLDGRKMAEQVTRHVETAQARA